MNSASDNESLLQQLLDLHRIDSEIVDLEREIQGSKEALTAMHEGVAGLDDALERIDTELEHARREARALERAVDEKRDALNRLRNRTNKVQNERQYSAATLEFDLVRQDLRKLEDQTLEKMQVVEELEDLRKEKAAGLEGAKIEAGPRGQQLEERVKELEEQLAIKRDRRHNLAIRIDDSALALYDRIHSGRSRLAMAPLTEDMACGNCFTAVTTMQEMEIRGMSKLITCEGCGVILYPTHLDK
ncbi:MAG: hypothetical protein GWN99_08605 [Gemmatimonadetes bacterium]|uniref:CT398-like coiled coil hairpin domain-containing protein n=1 Tax=Candidatus Kutchimonas denitrificans TaxID=3056748 RepID=A0AAE4ZC28_9BACT|nr:hypothetical protein [Gemmatimonadota bacterium]NIR76557.1 hypothetical protein [Candidatus Kutchimonas denitrificans]NIS01113.1 hypothetical protein [Gemmatimonadota bacterium]NIT66880.1 hypothetical protein [Gemmatimonadota bacterium]NIU54653.1 hypothetical protein [Gemmatimonadota bacterium]